MSVYVMADLHLSLSVPGKSMEIFGKAWDHYQDRIKANWQAEVREDDTVVIPGDISWSNSLPSAKEDFLFLESLPGIKYIGKGNHDFFWNTTTKLNRFLEECGYRSIRILYNNAYSLNREQIIICGTRGWFLDESAQKSVFETDFEIIRQRECIRLRLSLNEAKKLQEQSGYPILVFLHFPPVWQGRKSTEILSLLEEYGIKDCYFGHMHQVENPVIESVCNGIRMHFIAADALNFHPYPVRI